MEGYEDLNGEGEAGEGEDGVLDCGGEEMGERVHCRGLMGWGGKGMM